MIERIRIFFSKDRPNEIHFLKKYGFWVTFGAYTLTVLGYSALAGNLSILMGDKLAVIALAFLLVGSQLAVLAAALSTMLWIILLAYNTPDRFYSLFHETSNFYQILPFGIFIFAIVKAFIFEWIFKKNASYRQYKENYLTKLMLFFMCTMITTFFTTASLNNFLQGQVTPSQAILIERDVDVNFYQIKSKKGTDYYVLAKKVDDGNYFSRDAHLKRKYLKQLYQYEGQIKRFYYLDDSYNSIYHLATEDESVSFIGLCNHKKQCIRITEQTQS
jgi:hypothetical protein